MSQLPVQYEIDGSIGRLEFSNPEKLNALPQSGWLAIAPALETLVNNGARVIIVRGLGPGFCAGADISEFEKVRKNTKTAHIYEQSNIEAFSAIRHSSVPTIAQIHGYCLGGGFGLAAACDLRIAASGSTFGVPAAKLGLGYPVDAMADIVQSVGVQNAKRLLFTADRFSSEEMQKLGFLMDVVDRAELEETVISLAHQISSLAPLTHIATKSAIEAALGGDLKVAISQSDATFTSRDYEEGRNAFREKRSPNFIGS